MVTSLKTKMCQTQSKNCMKYSIISKQLLKYKKVLNELHNCSSAGREQGLPLCSY